MTQPYYIAWRYYLILSLIALAVLGLVGRIFNLAILDQHFLRHQGDERALRLVSTPAFRGMIVDRNGFPLAVSTSVYSAWVNPKEFTFSKDAVNSLSSLLMMKPKEIAELIKHAQQKKREFVYLKRSLSPEVASKLKSLSLPGLYTQQDYRRYYPEGEVMAHVVGFTNVDDVGQEGLELAYNQWLQGEQGKKWVAKDRIGRVISDVKLMQEQKPGHDLVLSIDRRIQYLAYRELMAGVIEHKAISGTAIVLDVKTGEVLAMVNQPSFNPNNRTGSNSSTFRNRAVTDSFEPGSTIKAFSVASALESGRYKPDSMIDTAPGWMRVGHNVVKDHNNNGLINVTQVLQLSSNMGVAKMVLNNPPDLLWSVLHRMGFGESTGINFQGEQNGSLVKHSPWGAFTLATLSFGYGLSVTALQLTRAYAVLANHGMKIPVTLLRVENSPAGERVMSTKVAKQMLYLLESVVEKGGTGVKANVPGYRVAGKTGTSLMAGDGGYQKHHYISSFVGIAPMTNPRFVVAVFIHDPHGKVYYGGDVSGPVFEKIMEGTLRVYSVPPDDNKAP
jgi:cell division protein FtsI (penicillin-binding protein 3)